MSVSVLDDKWTAEEFSAELEKMKSRDSEYSHTLQDSKEVAQKIEDSMLIYRIMGHEQDCSALTLVELGKYENDINIWIVIQKKHRAQRKIRSKSTDGSMASITSSAVRSAGNMWRYNRHLKK